MSPDGRRQPKGIEIASPSTPHLRVWYCQRNSHCGSQLIGTKNTEIIKKQADKIENQRTQAVWKNFSTIPIETERLSIGYFFFFYEQLLSLNAVPGDRHGQNKTDITSVCFPGGSVVKNSPAQCGRLRFDLRVGEIPWTKKMATHSSILAWKFPWTEEAVGLLPKGSQKSWT